jgi:membrane-associated phospholipid phosphatase
MTGFRQRQYASPLLSAPARRLAAVAIVCGVLILAGGAVLVHDQYADPLDRRGDVWAQTRLAGHRETLQLLADLGQKVALIVIVAVLCLACLAARRLNGAVLAAVGAPAACVATEKVLKPLASHLFVYAGYPSGRTTSYFALVATTAVLLARAPGGKTPLTLRTLRVTVVAAAVLVGCAVCVAVVALGDHRFIDTVGGAGVGIAVVLTATFVLDLPVSRRLLGLVSPTEPTRRPTEQST